MLTLLQSGHYFQKKIISTCIVWVFSGTSLPSMCSRPLTSDTTLTWSNTTTISKAGDAQNPSYDAKLCVCRKTGMTDEHLKHLTACLWKFWLFSVCPDPTEGERPADNCAGGRRPDHLHPDGPGGRSGLQSRHRGRDRRQERTREHHWIHDTWGFVSFFVRNSSAFLFLLNRSHNRFHPPQMEMILTLR